MSNWIEGHPKEIGLYKIIDDDGNVDVARVFDVGNHYPDGSMAYQVIGDEHIYQASLIERYKVLEGED